MFAGKFTLGDLALSLNLTSSVDVLSGNVVCSNTTVEFTCTASGVHTLGWRRKNSTVPVTLIKGWHIHNMAPLEDRNYPGIEVYLDKTTTDTVTEAETLVFTSVTSRLVSTVDHGLYNGDEIICLGVSTMNIMKSQILNYSIIMGI